MQLTDAVDFHGKRLSFPHIKSDPGWGSWEEVSIWLEGARCCSVLGKKVRLQEVRQRRARECWPRIRGRVSRRPWTPFQGRAGVREALAPEGVA